MSHHLYSGNSLLITSLSCSRYHHFYILKKERINLKMDYEELIHDFKESESTASPLWIWFAKEEKSATCTMCNTSIPRKDSTTGGMVNHLKRHHGFLSKNNAWKTYEELSSLKEKRLKNKRKIDPPDDQKKKQPKLLQCLPQKYGANDHRLETLDSYCM